MWFLILCLSLTLRWTGAADPVADRRSACKKRSHPWQVAIYDYDTFICGGVLVHPQWVLTASTCRSRHYELWMGIHNLHKQEITAQLANVTEYFPHPIYDLSAIKNRKYTSRVLYAEPSQDFMLLQLEKPVQITDFVDVVKLPTSELRQWNNCVAMGWGKCSEERIGMKSAKVSDILQCVDLSSLLNSLCGGRQLQHMEDFLSCSETLYYQLETCLGDTGGPVICDGILRGIVSMDYFPAWYPNVFMKLMPVMWWIRNTTETNP